ncbi:MAG: hypothetical protein ACQETE_09600 [Bacteroidota bacterium]
MPNHFLPDPLFEPRRWLWLLAWVIGYVFIIRAGREVVVGTIEPRVQVSAPNSDYQVIPSSVTTAIVVGKQDMQHTIQIFGGQYLLLSVAGLLLVSRRRKWFIAVGGIHILASVMNAGVFWLAIRNYIDLIVVSEALQQFIVPVLSLGLIPFAYWLDNSPAEAVNH